MDGGGGNAFDACENGGTAGVPYQHQNPVNANNPSNSGLDCLASGCHSTVTPGAGGSFQFAGTVYTATGGTTGAGGVNVRVKFGTTVINSVTDQAGNFYYIGSPLTFPAQTNVSSCPSIKPMITTISAANQGGCNSCHAPTPPPGGAPPIGLM